MFCSLNFGTIVEQFPEHISNLCSIKSSKLNIELPLHESIPKMAFTDYENTFIVAEYIWTGYITTTQRWINRTMNRTAPTRSTILYWRVRFLENGKLSIRGGNGRT